MIGIKDESILLDKKFRKQIIEEMTSPENVERKKESLRRYEIYKDQVRKWVIEALKKEFSAETLAQVENRASNISILKKVVNKLARAYAGGVVRRGETDQHTLGIEATAKATGLDTVMKKADRMLRLQQNVFVSCIPMPNYKESEEDKTRYDLQLKVYCPHSYDVIPDAANPELARCVILTDFVESSRDLAVQPYRGEDGRTPIASLPGAPGNNREETIAITPEDKGKEKRTFIWWSDQYHFTTDSKGKIIPPSPMDLANPIGEIPGEFLSHDRDGFFWAKGGDDLVDGAIMINIQLTDLYTIANVQGWGQPVLSGKLTDKSIKGGPHRALILTHEEGEPEPKFYYASSNPPLDQHMKTIEMTAALYLSTNNLSPTNIAGKLDASSFPSGIAKMVEDAQSTEPVEDSQHYFKEVEPKLWRKISKWQNRLQETDSLSEKFVLKPVPSGQPLLPEEAEVTIEFNKLQPVISEGEKLQNLKLRKEIGISSTLDLIMRDNPGMTKEEAEERLQEIEEESQRRAAMVAPKDQAAQKGSADSEDPTDVEVSEDSTDGPDAKTKGGTD